MFCRECGVQLEDNAKFCYKCGKEIEREHEMVEKTDADIIKEVYADIKDIIKDIWTFKTLKIVLVMIACIILFISLYNGFSTKQCDSQYERIDNSNDNELSIKPVEEIAGESTFESDYLPGEENEFGISNANLGGSEDFEDKSFITSQGNWLYYIFDDTIYKKNGDDAPVPLIHDNNLYCINVCGDYIYYSKYCEKNSVQIFSIKTDGSEQACIISEAYDTNFVVINYGKDILYISSEYVSSSIKAPIIKRYNVESGQDEICCEIPDCENVSSYGDRALIEAVAIKGYDKENDVLYMTECYGTAISTDRNEYNIAKCNLTDGSYERLLSMASWGNPVSVFVCNDKVVADVNDFVITYDKNSWIEEFTYKYDSYCQIRLMTCDEKNIVFTYDFVIWHASANDRKYDIGKAYKIAEDGGEPGAIIGDWFYYKTYNDDYYNIYRVNLKDGTWENFSSK